MSHTLPLSCGSVEIIITCVTNPASVGEVYEGNDGIVSAIQPGQIAVDHTTVGPGTSQRIHSAVTAKGAGFIDAPVSGGTAGAESGTLTIIVRRRGSRFR